MPVLAIAAFVADAITDVGLAGAFIGSALGGAVAGSAGAIAGTIAGDAIGTAIGYGLVIEAVVTASDLLLGSNVGQDGGTQVNFMANPQAGVPYAIGRTGTAGTIVFVDSAGNNSKYLTYVSVASLGPIQKSESFQANTISVIFDADNGEGAGHQNTLTSTQSANAVGATVIQVGDATAFSNGQNITIGGVNYTIANVYQGPKELQLRSGLTQAVPIYTPVEGPTVTSGFLNRMWLKTQLGEPSSPYLTFTSTNSKDTPANHSGIPTVWTASCKLSGLAARMWTLEYDAQVYSGGTPGPMEVVQGVFCYDPRQDSTYPGGSGPCRSNDETTWVYSENPYVHAITWLIGRTSNGVPTMGVHVPIAAIDMAAFVTGANVADANNWKAGGVIYSTDKKWDALVTMLQAGSGTPLKLGAKISCMVNTPLVSLDTLTGDDVVGSASIATTTASRDRINAVWPRYREEQQGWQIVPTQTVVVVPAYVAVDGGQRTQETSYGLVQSATQASVLAAYDIENAREIAPITLACKPRWMGYKPGDCITINEPEYGLINQTVLIQSREVDPASLITTLTVRTETTAKHAFALGQTNTAPVTPSVQGFNPSVFAGPIAGDWTATGGLIESGAQTVPVINVVGAIDNALAASIIVQYSPAGLGDWTAWAEAPAATTSFQITGLAPGAPYDVQISYRSVKGVISAPTVITPDGGVETGGLTVSAAASVPWTGVTDPAGTRPANNATVGATTGVNLYSGVYGTLSDTGVYTPIGTAAQIAGQGSNATTNLYVQATPPTGALNNGDLWLDESTSPYTWRVYNAGGWRSGAEIAFGPTPPASPNQGDLWINTSAAPYTLSRYVGAAWVVVSANGATTGQTLYSLEYGVLSDPVVYTPVGTAAMVSGQTGWATFADMLPSVLTQPFGNMVYNATFALGTAGWTSPSGPTPASAVDASGPYGIMQTAGAPGYYFMLNSATNLIGPGGDVYISASLGVSGAPADFSYVQILWCDPTTGDGVTTSAPIECSLGPWTPVQAVVTAPTTDVPSIGYWQAKMVCAIYKSSAAGEYCTGFFKQIMGSPYGYYPFNDVSTSGSLSTGIFSQAYGAQTESNILTNLGTASAIVGQGTGATTNVGALATQNSLALGSGYLTGFGAIAAESSLAYGSGYLIGFAELATLSYVTTGASGQLYSTTYSFLTDLEIYTPIGTASAIAGQGQLATANVYVQSADPAASGSVPNGSLWADTTHSPADVLKIRVSGSWSIVANFTANTGMTVSASPTSVTLETSSTGLVTVGSTTVTAAGGSGFIYNWALVNGTSFGVSALDGASISFTQTVEAGQSIVGTYRCTVQNSSGAIASVDVIVRVTNTA